VHVEERELGEERLLDQLPEGADENGPRLRDADPLQRRLLVDVLRLQQLEAELSGSNGSRGRLHLAAAPLAPVRRGDDEARAVR
jgi:hypothetical protein